MDKLENRIKGFFKSSDWYPSTKRVGILSMIAYLVILLSACDSQNSKDNNMNNINTTEGVLFKRSTLLVADLEQSLNIYRDILGFQVFKIEDSAPDSYSYPVFKIPTEAKIRFATLSSKTQVRTLALTEVTGIELPKPGIPLMSAAVIKVDQLDKVMQKIRDLGLESTEPKVDGGTDFTFKEQAFIDFDGHLVVLYEILPE